jgi:exopolysaccharide production protein ExoZ
MEPVVFVGWTLNYEMMFYAIFASGMVLPRTVGLVVTLLVLGVAAIAGQLFRFSDPILSFYTAPIAIEFGFGILLGMLFVSDRLPRTPRWRLPVAAIALVAFAAMVMGPWLWRDADRAVMFGIPAFVIVGCALIAERSGLALKARWLQLLGAASYAIYLTHFFSTQIVVKLARHLTRFGATMMMVLALLAFALVVLVGIAVHKKIELPLTALARRASNQRRSTAAIKASANTALAESATEPISYSSLPAEPISALRPTES